MPQLLDIPLRNALRLFSSSKCAVARAGRAAIGDTSLLSTTLAVE
jgi:hypothetical protein